MTRPSAVGRGAALISASLICFCAGGLYGWSALIPFLEQRFVATTEQSGLVFSVAIVAFSMAVIASPRLPPAFTGLQGCVMFACLGTACLLFAMIAPSYLWFLLSFGVGFGLCSGAMYINALATAALSMRPAVVTPAMVACFGLGGAVFGLVWRWLILLGWGVFALLPLALSLMLSCVVGFAVSRRSHPSEAAAVVATREPYPLKKPGVLVLLWISFALGSAGGLMVLGLAGKMTDSVGASAAITSIAIAGVAIGNTLGRLSVSGFNCVFKPINTAIMAVGLAAIGLMLTGLAASPNELAIGLIVVAVGYGAVASTIPALVSVIYGKHDFSHMFSIVFSAWGVAGLVAPWLAGGVYDRTGEFQMAILLALLATTGSVVTLMLLKLIGLK